MEAGHAVTLDRFITAKGLPLPRSHFHLTGLAHSVSDRALQHPLGDWGGGLSWPIPLSPQEQRTARAAAIRYLSDHPNPPPMGPRLGVLEYLNSYRPLSGETLQDPAKALASMVNSARGHAMGQALQTQMNGVATDSSVNDYTLAAIHLMLDPESIAHPHRNRVAGFDLAQKNHWGKPASAVLEGLSKHLSDYGKTSPEMAKVGAYLLLAKTAPEFLVKDIPDSVTYGSQTWVSLAVAAAAIEAQSPGKVPNMTFAQVMQASESATLNDLGITQQAQKAALVDWGVINGILPRAANDHYSADDVDRVKTLFNQQMGARKKASELLSTEIPSRKDIALAKLKERFGDQPYFEDKALTVVDTSTPTIRPLYDPDRLPVGPHSMLDIAMMGLDNLQWKTVDPNDKQLPLTEINAGLKLGVGTAFDEQFTQAIQSLKDGIAPILSHQLTQQTLDDRAILGDGKIELFQTLTSTLGTDFKSKTSPVPDDKLLVKATHRDKKTGEDKVTAYEISLSGGVKPILPIFVQERSWRTSNQQHEIKPFTPTNDSIKNNLSQRRDNAPSPPEGFFSARTQALAQAFVEHLNLDDKTIKEQARGTTPLDQQMKKDWEITNFFLDLIPLRSAIVNFQQGNYADGAADLAMDAVGFLTAGIGAAGKVAKVGSKAISTAAKALKVARIIGTTTISELNPLGGLDDLILGGSRLVGKGISKGAEAINKLRGATGGYDLLKAVSREYGVAATGTLKVADQSIEAGAVLKEGKWYAFDTDKMQPYGQPLKDFTPGVRAMEGQTLNLNLSDWIYQKLAGEIAPPPPSGMLGRYVPKDFQTALERAKQPNNVMDYELGYTLGKPGDIVGYDPALSIPELQALASQRFLSHRDVGTLARQIEREKVKLSQDGIGLFQRDVQAAGGTVTPISQEYYLSQVNLASEGECAGMANALGLAIESGTENTFLGNLFSAASKPKAAKEARFIGDLNTFHNKVSNSETFHMGKPVRQVPYQTIISELASAPPGKTLRIATQDHAILAGVTLRDNKPMWFYFDPNFGLAKFDSAQSMSEGLERTLNKGTSRFQLRAHGTTPGAPEYRISEFAGSDMMTHPDRPSLSRMISEEL
ncbi:hypothetical protein HX855_00055 [Pseudomonas sp. IPO3778]|nr:hypothetical protein [Pseudomonas sp. IPO3779]NWD15187.1 hypothetical protein [Pseudomonas sp. IPO3778]